MIHSMRRLDGMGADDDDDPEELLGATPWITIEHFKKCSISIAMSPNSASWIEASSWPKLQHPRRQIPLNVDGLQFRTEYRSLDPRIELGVAKWYVLARAVCRPGVRDVSGNKGLLLL